MKHTRSAPLNFSFAAFLKLLTVLIVFSSSLLWVTSSSAAPGLPPVNTAPPSITVEKSATTWALIANDGSWNGVDSDSTFKYRWFRWTKGFLSGSDYGWVEISEPSDPTEAISAAPYSEKIYHPIEAFEQGSVFKVEVSAINQFGTSDPITSEPVVFPISKLRNMSRPKIKTIKHKDKVVSSSLGEWASTSFDVVGDEDNYIYAAFQWQISKKRNGNWKPASSAVGRYNLVYLSDWYRPFPGRPQTIRHYPAKYKIKNKDRSKYIRLHVWAVDARGWNPIDNKLNVVEAYSKARRIK